MARYRGPEGKLVRNKGVSAGEIPKAAKLKRTYPSGVHGQQRKKMSEYGIQLLEKQRIRMTYGLIERQFYKNYQEAVRQKGVTGTILLQRLESRLDNILFRSGLARTRRQARQFVTHSHILVNGKRLNIPSYLMKPGDVITIRERSREMFKAVQETSDRPYVPEWIETDFNALAVRVNALPERHEIDQTFNEHLVIEYYSR